VNPGTHTRRSPHSWVATATATFIAIAISACGAGRQTPTGAAVPATSATTHSAAARSTSVTTHLAASPSSRVAPHPQAAAGRRTTVAEVRDPEEGKSFPVSPQVRARYRRARTPKRVADGFVAPGALSTAQVRSDLAQVHALERAEQAAQATLPGGDSVGGNGTIPIPPDVPLPVQQAIAGANAITDTPYVYGGGHVSFVDNAYDCSGSVSYALAAAGLLAAPETSGQLESWGAPGPGKWITIYASAGHVYMYVNIGGAWMRYDTVGRSGPFASRWQPAARSNEGFVARHWPGL
jgi:cell wall-associated NlpC family hydrolase